MHRNDDEEGQQRRQPIAHRHTQLTAEPAIGIPKCDGRVSAENDGNPKCETHHRRGSFRPASDGRRSLRARSLTYHINISAAHCISRINMKCTAMRHTITKNTVN